jgi:hypothetical protein
LVLVLRMARMILERCCGVIRSMTQQFKNCYSKLGIYLRCCLGKDVFNFMK